MKEKEDINSLMNKKNNEKFYWNTLTKVYFTYEKQECDNVTKILFFTAVFNGLRDGTTAIFDT